MYSTEGYLVSLLSMNKVVDGIKHALDIEGVSRKGVHYEEKTINYHSCHGDDSSLECMRT